jgi:hypothetical protein
MVSPRTRTHTESRDDDGVTAHPDPGSRPSRASYERSVLLCTTVRSSSPSTGRSRWGRAPPPPRAAHRCTARPRSAWPSCPPTGSCSRTVLSRARPRHAQGFPESYDHGALVAFVRQLAPAQPGCTPVYCTRSARAGNRRSSPRPTCWAQAARATAEQVDLSVWRRHAEADIERWYTDRFLEPTSRSGSAQFTSMSVLALHRSPAVWGDQCPQPHENILPNGPGRRGGARDLTQWSTPCERMIGMEDQGDVLEGVWLDRGAGRSRTTGNSDQLPGWRAGHARASLVDRVHGEGRPWKDLPRAQRLMC